MERFCVFSLISFAFFILQFNTCCIPVFFTVVFTMILARGFTTLLFNILVKLTCIIGILIHFSINISMNPLCTIFYFFFHFSMFGCLFFLVFTLLLCVLVILTIITVFVRVHVNIDSDTYRLKGTVMHIEKALTNHRLHVSKVS